MSPQGDSMSHTSPNALPMTFQCRAHGHVKITDDLGQVLLDQDNAVHPENMARVIARALSHEPNYQIYRVAFGNGGTTVSAGNTITYKTPNDGQLPDPAGWQSRLYNETFSIVIDDQSPLFGTGVGTSNIGSPPSVPGISGPGVRSTELGLISTVLVDVVLNASEPLSETLTDTGTANSQLKTEFTFDEMGLYSPGLSDVNTAGTQAVNLPNLNIQSNTGLNTAYQYSFGISVNGGTPQTITITTPNTGTGVDGTSTYVSYADILPLINTAIAPYGASASISDITNGIDTGGNLVFKSTTNGPGSSILLTQTLPAPANWLFNHLLGYVSIGTPVAGQLAGVQDNPADPNTVRERLLTHIIFSPILKSANRTLSVQYTLSIAVARTIEPTA